MQIQNANILAVTLDCFCYFFSASSWPNCRFCRNREIHLISYDICMIPNSWKSCSGSVHCLKGILHKHKSCSQVLVWDPCKEGTWPEHALLHDRSLWKGQNKFKPSWTRNCECQKPLRAQMKIWTHWMHHVIPSHIVSTHTVTLETFWKGLTIGNILDGCSDNCCLFYKGY